MWPSPVRKPSDPVQRDAASADKSRRESGSSAAPILIPEAVSDGKDATTAAASIPEQTASEQLQAQDPKAEGLNDPFATPSLKSRVSQAEQRDYDFPGNGDKPPGASASEVQSQAGSFGSGVFGKLKGLTSGLRSLGGGAGQTVQDVVKEPLDLSVLKGLSVQEGGNIQGPSGEILGRVVEGGDNVVGGVVEVGGKIVDEAGNTIGQAELVQGVQDPADQDKRVPESVASGTEKATSQADLKSELGKNPSEIHDLAEEAEDAPESALGDTEKAPSQVSVGEPGLEKSPSDIQDAAEEAKGLPESIPPASTEKALSQSGLGGSGLENPLSEAQDATEDALEKAEDGLPPLSSLEGLTCNKMGKIISPSTGKPVGELIEGDPKKLSRLGSKCDDKGQFWDSRGNIVGKAQTLRFEDFEDEPPFAGLEGLHIVADGFVEDANGATVGKITEGDAAKLIGRPVDEDGDITDTYGSVKGHAEPYEAPEEEKVEDEDLSILEGKIVNKAGNVVDEHGKVYGRIISGDGKRLAGKKVDSKGQIWGDAGTVIGRAELIPGAEQEKPEGLFYGFQPATVGKDSLVLDRSGRTIGRVTEGDFKRLQGRSVDEDGDILDKNGNVIGKAERWEPEEKQRSVNPMAGRRVTREGEVRDVDGNLIGKLTTGNLATLAGKEIDDNGYVVDNDGNKIGECTLLENLPEEKEEVVVEEEEEEPEPSPEEIEAQKKEEADRDLAKKMSAVVSPTLDQVQPICKMIKQHIDKADRTPRNELDEEELVRKAKPLIEEAGRLLQECNGAIRALDPDGRIAATAKARAASHEATPEEYALAEKLKDLTDTVVSTIDEGKRKIEDMPHAKKELNPLWGLLSEPLFQIIAAVGLLLTGVLGLVGRLLDGLGLGGLVRGLLGGLGLDKLLGNLGLTALTDALGITGNKKK